ncbi:head-tail connector protein [Aeromonas salmonicida]|uniref:head-tail connector protein n=1 Tax=Aeromonas salmonicida TaxID=645 RepID=UPI003CFD1227
MNYKPLEYFVEFRDTSLINELLSNDLLQQHLILIEDESELLDLYKNAAIAAAEKLMNRPIVPSKIVVSANSTEFRLPYGGYLIESCVDDNGNPTLYKLNPVTKKVTIQGNPVFPITLKVSCDFSATGEGNVPDSVILGVCMAVATSYQNRESVVLGISAAEIPYSQKAIFQQYRIPNNAGGV